jgi:hypothetical protein
MTAHTPSHAAIKRAHTMAVALEQQVQRIVNGYGDEPPPNAIRQVDDLAHAAAMMARCLATLEIEYSPELRAAIDPAYKRGQAA